MIKLNHGIGKSTIPQSIKSMKNKKQQFLKWGFQAKTGRYKLYF